MKKIKLGLIFLLLFSGCRTNYPFQMLLVSSGYLPKETTDGLPNYISSANQKLAISMFEKLRSDDSNTFLSPVSLSLALGMTLNGASGETLNEMKAALKVDNLSNKELNAAFKELQLTLLNYHDITFKVNNSIWINDTYQDNIKEEFIEVNKEYYNPLIAAADFSKEAVVKGINDWVYKNINKTIEKAIDDNITDDTQLILINTLYFLADFKKPFPKDNTYDDMFLNEEVKMMSQINYFDYYENDLGQFISLPYKNDDLSLLIGLPHLKGKLALSDLLAASKFFENTEVNLKMPKVKTELTYDLNNYLISENMRLAFNSDKADFSNLSSNPVNNLYISEVTQKTYLVIDEKGTEAAAMTKVGMKDTALPLAEVELYLNRPFIFAIYDKSLDIVYFVGEIVNFK